MPIQDDFSISAGGDIRYTGTTATYTVIQLHRWLGDLMDDAVASGNDLLDITDSTASERSTDNIITLNMPYNIDDAAAQKLYDGSVIQKNGDEIYDGILVFAAAGMYLDVIQNGDIATNFWTTGLNADANNGISHRFMLKTRTAGADIDGRRLIGQTREFGFTYSEFKINGTARGNNVMALTYAVDLNNQTPISTVAGWNAITNTEGFRTIDVNNDGTPENYYSEWNRATFTINQFYERMKWLTRRGSTSTIYGFASKGFLFRGITHEVTLAAPRAGNFAAVENVSWGSGATAGTGKMLAVNSPGTATKMWIQILTGVAPSGSVVITGATSAATATNSGAPIDRTGLLSFPFVGASTGSALIGSYGLGLEATDLGAADKVFDLTNAQRVPPNYVTFTVSGLVPTEDRVLVGPAVAGVLNQGQFKLNAAILASATSVVVKAGTETPGTGQNAATDTPATGTIRVQGSNGVYARVTYTGVTHAAGLTTFTGCVGAPAAALDANVFVSYIDTTAATASVSYTSVYVANRDLFVRVRDGGGTPIKTFETPATLGGSGGSATAIRTSDL
jgi:hypothetical protein